MYKIIFIILFLIPFNAFAGDEDKLKKGVIEKITSGGSNFISNAISGDGDTEVQITAGEDYKPEFSIMTVRSISHHPGVDAIFVQLQLNDTKIRGDNRLSINTGIGYRKLSDSKSSFVGGNVFIDYDEEGNSRGSIGIELRASSFEALANYYQAISGGQKVGNFTERVLDGVDISLIGQIPYLPWASIIANTYEWKANKNSKNSKGNKISIEMQLTPNLVIDVGYDDNNIDGSNNFAKIMFVYPPRKKSSATSEFISSTPFVNIDMSGELLTKVRRTNKIIVESENTGFVMARGN